MRWTRLFDDLEAQLALQEQADLVGEVAEHTRAERGRVGLDDRLAVMIHCPVALRVQGVGRLAGTVQDVGADWVVLRTSAQAASRSRHVLVTRHAILSLSGLSPRADQRAGLAQRHLDLRHAVRALSRDRSVVRFTDIGGGELTGTIDRVGRDHVDLSDHAEDEPRRAAAVRTVHTVPFAALAIVRQF